MSSEVTNTGLNVGKTIYKTAEPTVGIVVAAQILKAGLAQVGIVVDDAFALTAATIGYGLFNGIRNAIKNRKK